MSTGSPNPPPPNARLSGWKTAVVRVRSIRMPAMLESPAAPPLRTIATAARAERIHQTKILRLPCVPTVASGVFQGASGHLFAPVRVADHFQQGRGQGVHVSRFEKANHRIIKIEPVNFRARDNHRNAQ